MTGIERRQNFVFASLAALVACHGVSVSAQPTAPPAPAPATAPASTPPQSAAAKALKPFSARYKIEFFGIPAGTADIILTNGTSGRYQYTTAPHPNALARFWFPSHGTLTSLAETDGFSVRPLQYREEDGTKATDEDVSLDFDWSQGVVHGVAHDEPVRLPLAAHTQDPMSLQLAVLMDFANKRAPAHYAMVDKTQIKEYDYKSEGQTRLDTALGPLDTVIYTSSRPGASKITRVWYAPALDFVQVRSEDSDNGRVRVRVTITSLKR